MRGHRLGAALLILVSVPAWAGDLEVDGSVVSNTTTQPPLAVSSTLKVNNFNADLLDGLEASAFATQVQATSLAQRPCQANLPLRQVPSTNDFVLAWFREPMLAAPDTRLAMTYVGTSSATVDLYLYASDGTPLKDDYGNSLCEPCTYSLSDGGTEQELVSFDDLIDYQANGAPDPLYEGYARVVVSGDPDFVALMAFVWACSGS